MFNNQQGIAAFLIVLIISIAASIIAINGSRIGIGEAETSYNIQKGGAAIFIAEGCIEETLRRLKLDNNYGLGMGQIILSVLNGSCIVQVNDLGSGRRQIISTGSSDNYSKKTQVEITPNVEYFNLDKWEEI